MSSSQGGQGSLDPESAAPAAPDSWDLAALMDAHKGTGRPFLAGTFALYADPSGAVVLVTETDGQGVQQRTIPGQLVKLASNPGKLGRMIGLGR